MATDTTAFDKYITPAAFILGAVIIAFALMFGRGGAPAGEQGAKAPSEVDIADVKTGTSPSVGQEDAPVTIAVWFDYQCGYCQNYEKNTMAQVYANYVTTGQVRILYKDYQFFGEESERLSAFGRGVHEANPESFHAWIAAVMAAQTDKAFGTQASIEALSRTIPGVDVDRVNALVAQNGSAYAAAAEADRTEGTSFGITGTPGTIIGTTMIPGSRSYDELKVLIDAELAK